MPLQHHQLAFTRGAMPALASWLLERQEDLADGVVILPSTRAAAVLGRTLLAASGREALLLPTIVTPPQLADWLAGQFGDARDDLPHPSLRPLLLAPHLAASDWLVTNPAAATGLAEELVALFDEVRWAGCDHLVLAGADDARLLSLAAPEAAETVLEDLVRVRQAWQAYRASLPVDQVDLRLTALGRGWPGRGPAWVVAAHLGRLERRFADWLLARAEADVPAHLVSFAAQDARSRWLLATYRDADAETHPLAGARRLARRLAATELEPPRFEAQTVAGRLAELDTRDLAAGDVVLWACHDPEQESRVVAGRVGAELAAAGDGAVPEVIVATPDRALAARVVAQLRDAGVDVDDTRGRALAALPAGRLLGDILRVIQTGWRFGPLFEVLTHPYVNLAPAGRPAHAVLARTLEGAVREAAQTRGGREALATIAGVADDRERARRGGAALGWTLASFVAVVAAAFAPLDELGARPVGWDAVVAAIRKVWQNLAPDHPLRQEAGHQKEIDDLGGLAGLLDVLADVSPHLPPQAIGEIASEVERLLKSSAWEQRPHRAEHLPVRVMGLVEARLDSADLVILAGLGQETFPGKIDRPLFLDDRVRRGLELTHWRERAGRDSELFLRLLHAAPRVVITWSSERQGQPALPSPLAQRLQIVAPAGTGAAAPAVFDILPRRVLPDWDAIAAAERAFVAEGAARIVAGIEPPTRLSHAAVSELRGCPYRYLLGRVLRLRRAEVLEPAYTRLEYGQFAHEVMRGFLLHDGAGWRALAAADAAGAERELRRLADLVADAGLPQARLWRETFVALVPELVAGEIARAAQWRPAVLEVPFTLTLAEIAAWLRAAGREEDAQYLTELPEPVPIEGRIDRLDLARDGSPRAAVIDFKTGRPATAADVRDGLELQVALYALAVEAGTVHGLAPAPGGGRWRVDHGGYYGLRADAVGLPRGPQLPAGDGGREVLAQAAAILLRLAVDCLQPGCEFPLVREENLSERGRKLPCEFCEFRAVCRVEERLRDGEIASRLTSYLTGDWRRYT
jgi:ATP-dependent helicase/nuclease subunit B